MFIYIYLLFTFKHEFYLFIIIYGYFIFLEEEYLDALNNFVLLLLSTLKHT
jgi:hypothetical protein